MRKLGVLALTRALVLVGGCLLLVPATGYADNCDRGLHVGDPHCGQGPLPFTRPAATPELDSFVLFGAGLLGLGGVGFVRRRREARPPPGPGE